MNKSIFTKSDPLYVVYSANSSVSSRPMIQSEALALYQSWSAQGGECLMYRCVPVAVTVTVTAMEQE